MTSFQSGSANLPGASERYWSLGRVNLSSPKVCRLLELGVGEMDTHLSLDGVWAIFGGFVAVKDLSLHVERGAIHCLLGPNGAGKSTLLDLICGKVIPPRGNITFNGKTITNLKEYKRNRLGVGRKFQVPMVFPDLTVEENLAVADKHKSAVWSGLSSWWSNYDKDTHDRILDDVGLGQRVNTLAKNLSHGEIQWLEIAMLLVQDCSLLLMDEPTAGMTSEETAKTGEIFSRLRGRHTLVVVEHDMQFVRDIAEKVTVLHQGQILAEGSVQEIQSNEDVQRVYLGNVEVDNALSA